MERKKEIGREGESLFDHEKMEVYRVALEYLAFLHGALKNFPSGSADLRDHLDRAGTSITLNIPEGNAKPRHSRDRRKFFRTARGSAQESAGGWDAARIKEYASPETAARAKEMLRRIVSMLFNLAP